jgi:hypothetical protein
VAKEEAEGGAEVVELRSGDALDLGVAGGIKPGVFAIEDEEFSGCGGVLPAHFAGLLEQECAGFIAGHAEAVELLAEAGAKAVEQVVMGIDGAGELHGGGLGEGYRGQGEQDGGGGEPET